MPVPVFVPNPSTRYFFLCKPMPDEMDMDFIVATAQKVNGYLRMRTKTDRSGRLRLAAVLILRGPRTWADDMRRMFPNFLVLPMNRRVDLFDKLDRAFDSTNDYVTVEGRHPYEEVRTNLFK